MCVGVGVGGVGRVVERGLNDPPHLGNLISLFVVLCLESMI